MSKQTYITTNEKNEVARKHAEMVQIKGSATGWIGTEVCDPVNPHLREVYGQVGGVKIVLGATTPGTEQLAGMVDGICTDFKAFVAEKIRTGQFVRIDWIEALRMNGWPLWKEAAEYRGKWYARKEDERVKAVEYGAEREAKEEWAINDAEQAYKIGVLISCKLFLRLCNRHGVSVPKQTIGMLRARFEGVARDRFAFRAVRGKGKPDQKIRQIVA